MLCVISSVDNPGVKDTGSMPETWGLFNTRGVSSVLYSTTTAIAFSIYSLGYAPFSYLFSLSFCSRWSLWEISVLMRLMCTVATALYRSLYTVVKAIDFTTSTHIRYKQTDNIVNIYRPIEDNTTDRHNQMPHNKGL